MSRVLFDALLQEARAVAARTAESLGEDASPDAIHDHRITTKMLRSYWIAARPAVGREATHASVRRLRAAARLMSDTRDAHVRRKTIDSIGSRARKREKRALSRIAGDLQALFGDPAGLSPERIVEFHSFMKEEVLAWTAAVPGHDEELDALILREGIGRTYRKARSFSEDAAILNTPAGYHRMRRWVKYLRYQIEWLLSMGFEELADLKRDVDKLGKRLGQLHDIHKLHEFIEEHSTHITKPRDLAPVEKLLQREATKLARKSIQESRELFKRSPKRFGKRLVKMYAARSSSESPAPSSEEAAEEILATAGDDGQNGVTAHVEPSTHNGSQTE